MVKTKKSVARPRRSIALQETPVVSKVSKKTEAQCDTTCVMCWLFKVMIALFIFMVVFWLGFCFGALNLSVNDSKMISKMSRGKNGMCMPALNANMDTMMSNMNYSLENKTGDTFDKEFLLQMSIHHEGAVDMAKKALESSNRSEIKNLAQSIIASQSGEITQMKAWLDQWFVK